MNKLSNIAKSSAFQESILFCLVIYLENDLISWQCYHFLNYFLVRANIVNFCLSAFPFIFLRSFFCTPALALFGVCFSLFTDPLPEQTSVDEIQPNVDEI
jgi:hypothetical protein